MSTPGPTSRYQFPPVPEAPVGMLGVDAAEVAKKVRELVVWSSTLVAALSETQRILEESPIAPMSVELATGTVALATSATNVATKMLAVGGDCIILFSCAIQGTQTTSVKEVALRIQRDDTTDVLAEEEVWSLATGSSTLYGSVAIHAKDTLRAAGVTYDVDMRAPSGGTISVTDRCITIIELRG